MAIEPPGRDEGSPPSELPQLSEQDGLSQVHLHIYRFLIDRWHNPPTMNEIRDAVTRVAGPQTQTDRRVRELYPHVEIAKVRLDHSRSPGYRVLGPANSGRATANRGVSGRIRAEVLAPQRCAMCGRTPLDDAVKLVVDHKLPQKWGGTDDPSNLQPLCEDCNGGKQAWFASFDKYGDAITAAGKEGDPHRRIGELLRAFKGEWVPSDLIGAVASMGAYQEDWQKRLRELRTLGWVIDVQKQHAKSGSRRVTTAYRARTTQPWPDGPTRQRIAAIERDNRVRGGRAID